MQLDGTFITSAVDEMIAEDISQGKERVKVPVVNELNDEMPTEFGVISRYSYNNFVVMDEFLWCLPRCKNL